MNIYVLRHLRTRYNQMGVISGRSLNLPIVDVHKIQYNISFDGVYCSPALRCIQTIDLLSPAINPTIVCCCDEILERDLGIFEGLSKKKAIEAYPQFFQNGRFDVFSTPPNGESYNNFCHRVHLVAHRLISSPYDNILVCAHNQALKMLYFELRNISITSNTWDELDFNPGIITKIY